MWQDAVFLDFMQRALCWDPATRLTPAEALNHPWILRGQGSRAQGGDTTPSASAAQLARVKVRHPLRTSLSGTFLEGRMS